MARMEQVLLDVVGANDDISWLILDYLPQEEQYFMVSVARQRLLELRHCGIRVSEEEIETYFKASDGQKLNHSIDDFPSAIYIRPPRAYWRIIAEDPLGVHAAYCKKRYSVAKLFSPDECKLLSHELEVLSTIPVDGEPVPREIITRYFIFGKFPTMFGECSTVSQETRIVKNLKEMSWRIYYALIDDVHIFALHQFHAQLRVEIPAVTNHGNKSLVPTLKIDKLECIKNDERPGEGDCFANEWIREFNARRYDISLLLQYFQPPPPKSDHLAYYLDREKMLKALDDWKKKRDVMQCR